MKDLLEALAEQARRVGVAPFSPEFDEAAALAGMPYSRAWDAYLDRETARTPENSPAERGPRRRLASITPPTIPARRKARRFSKEPSDADDPSVHVRIRFYGPPR